MASSPPYDDNEQLCISVQGVSDDGGTIGLVPDQIDFRGVDAGACRLDLATARSGSVRGRWRWVFGEKRGCELGPEVQ
jgi:hypothetical protein